MSVNFSPTQQNTLSSTYSSETQSTDSAAAHAPAGTASTPGVNPHNVFDVNAFSSEGISGAAANHRILSTPPPVPADHVQLTAKTRPLVSSAGAKIAHLASAGGGDKTVAHAIAQGHIARSEAEPSASSYSYNGVNIPTVPTYVTPSASSQTTTVTSPSGTTASSGATTMYDTTGSSGISYSAAGAGGTSGAAGSTQFTNAVNNLADDTTNNGKCGEGSRHHDAAKDQIESTGFNKQQTDWIFDEIRNSSDPKNDVFAKAVVALEQTDPKSAQHQQLLSRIKTDVSTMMATQSSSSLATSAGNNAAQAYGKAANDIADALQSLGISATTSDLGIGLGQNLPPTPGQNGWSVWGPETQS